MHSIQTALADLRDRAAAYKLIAKQYPSAYEVALPDGRHALTVLADLRLPQHHDLHKRLLAFLRRP